MVLDDISFEIEEGRFYGLVGVNGAGKTTLLKCLLDFCDFDAGSINVFGVTHSDATARTRLAYLPERFVPPFFLTGREFLKIMLGMSGVAFSEQEVAAALANLDLAMVALDRPVRSYSKGMMQKLGLAACFLSGKRLVVLDEPMGGLDPLARARVKRHLLELRGRGAATVLLTSHSLADIDEICDHMLVLHRGRIAFAGTPAAFRELHHTASLEEAFLRSIGSTVESSVESAANA